MKYILILWSVLWSLSALGQTFSYFNKTWGDEYNYRSFSSVLTVEDGYLTFGHYLDTLEYSSLDLSKFDFNGNLLWRKNLCIDSPNDSYILNKDMIENIDGDIIIGNLVEDFEEVSSRDTRLIKLTRNGDIIWKKDIGSELNESMNQLIQTNDGGYLVVGSKQNVTPVQFAEIYILKVDSEGNKEWEQSFGYGDEIANAVAATALSLNDGGFLIGGGLKDLEENNKKLVIKIDSLGNLIWEKRFETNCVIDIYEMSDGNYLLNSCKIIEYKRHPYLMKMDTAFNLIWEQYYAQLPESYGLYIDPVMKEDGGFIASVNHYNNSDRIQSTIVDFDSLGNINWTQAYTVDSLSSCGFTDVKKTLDGGYIWCGYQNTAPQKGWLLKTDCQGNTCSTVGCDSVYVHRDTLVDPLCGPLPYQEVCLSDIDLFMYSKDTVELVDSLFYDLPLLSNNSSTDFENYYYLCKNDSCAFFKSSSILLSDTGTYFIRGLNIYKEDSLFLETAIVENIPLDSLQYFLDYNFVCSSVMTQNFELMVVFPERECLSEIQNFTTELDSVTVSQNYNLPQLTGDTDSSYLNFYLASIEGDFFILQENEVLYSEPDTIQFWGVNIYAEDTAFINNIIEQNIAPDSLQSYFIESEICASITANKFVLIVRDEDTGFGDFLKEGSVYLYPNPASSKINLKTNLLESVHFNIYNNTGKLIKTKFVGAGNVLTSLEVSDLSNGVYFYQLISGENMSLQSGKFVVQY